jgi:hypothetical protein
MKKKKKKANLASARYLGALDMLSIPPTTTISFKPNWIDCAAIIVAETKKINKTSSLSPISKYSTKTETTILPFIPEEQTLLIVVQMTELGIPAPKAACLAGAWPKFALKTLPKKTSCTSEGSTFALLRAPTKRLISKLQKQKQKQTKMKET